MSFLSQLSQLNPKLNLDLIKRAYNLAEKAHRDQKRLSGEPYLIHCQETAKTLAKMKLDSQTVAAGLLHDIVDDTPITLKQIEKEFGSNIAFLIKGVSKLGKLKYRGQIRYVENLRRMFLAMAEDIRVVLIKLADRLHNMQTLQALPEEKQIRIARETLEIYAPLANRLGIGEIKGQLEDLAFPYVYPKEFAWLIKTLPEKYQAREEYLKKVKPVLEKELKSAQLEPLEIQTRAKHHFSLYKKLCRYEMNWEKIYDLVAMRIIVKTIPDCYAALGVIHKNWKPLPGRIKDYIAVPKPNGYQSLHTTVFCLEGKITEFQIRTPKMHQEAEYGIAAHWAYTEADKPKQGVLVNSPQLAWINQLREWQKEVKASPDEFLESLKIDFFKDRIFVFTPKGDVIDLPEGATPVDFAYQIHTDIGHSCAEAKIDGKLSPLHQPLENGQVVEIVTKKEKKPNPDWLRFVKTTQAKSKIRAFLKKIAQE